MTALIIIDVQKGLFDKRVKVYNSENMLKNINLLEAHAKANKMPIVYVQHENKTLVYNSDQWQLHSALSPDNDDLFIRKNRGNSFEGTGLAKILLEMNITKVIVCGLVSHGCVKRGALGAADNGFEVFLASDAHSNWRKNAEELIGQVNLELDSMGIIIKTTAQLVSE